MDPITEAALKSYRDDIDYLHEQLEATTRALLLVATHAGMLESNQLLGVLGNDNRTHVHIVVNGSGSVELQINQPAANDAAKKRAALLPRHKLERAYIAEHERATLAEAALAEARNTEPEELTDKPKVGVPEPPDLDGHPTE